MKRSHLAGDLYLAAMLVVLLPLVFALLSGRPYIFEHLAVAIGGGLALAVSSYCAFEERYAVTPSLPVKLDYRYEVSWVHLSPRAMGVISCGLIIALAFIVPWYYLTPFWTGVAYPLPDIASVIVWSGAAMLALAGAICYEWTPK